ncbi:MAG: lysylphosphatidylglycerol synthase transmembrane domain-containing protein [Candidatus Nealsonbacteria bacterium]
MKKLLLFILSLLVGIGIFIWVIKMVGWEELEKDFRLFQGTDGLIILGLTLMTMAIGIWRWREILKSIGVKLPPGKMISPFLAGFSIMFLAPILIWGGEVLRTYILKHRNDVPWSKGMASVIIDRILEWTANLVVIFLGGIIFLFFNDFPTNKFVIIFVGLFLFFVVLLIFFFIKCYKRESISAIFLRKRKDNLLEVEKEIFNFFKRSKLATWKAIALSFLRVSIMYVRVWFLITFLGKSVAALSALSILGFSYLAIMIPIPTALGTHEAIQSFAFNSLGLGISTATAFTMIIRVAELAVAFTGVVLLFRFGIIIMRDKILSKIESLSDED